jgi:8-oxo-dGTP pyrophosphatase MutT (NUDIX family)
MTREVHVTVVVERDGEFLLVEERIDDKTVLNQPAGHWEEGETLVDAARREALEETAWDVEPVALLGVYEYAPADLDYSFLRFAFVARAVKHHPEQSLDEGIERALWLSRADLVAQLRRHRSPMVLLCVDDYLAGTRLPLTALAHLPRE